MQARQRKSDRAADTRQKVLLGAFLRKWMQKDEEMGKRVMRGLDAYLTRDIDRVHVGLELRGDGTLKGVASTSQTEAKDTTTGPGVQQRDKAS